MSSLVILAASSFEIGHRAGKTDRHRQTEVKKNHIRATAVGMSNDLPISENSNGIQ